MNKRLIFLISTVTVLTLSIVAINPFTSEKSTSNSSSNNVVLAAESTIPQVPIESLSKEDVQLKMLNAINNIDNANGSLEVTNKLLDSSYTIDFKIKKDSDNKSYEKYVDKSGSTRYIICINDELTTFNDANKTVEVEGYLPGTKVDKTKDTKVTDRYSKNDKDEKVYKFRPASLGINYSRVSLDPQEIALGFLESYEQWNFKKGESYLGFSTIVIEGNFNDYYKGKFKSDKFEITIDSETGVVLKLRKYNSTTNEDSEVVTVTSLNLKNKVDDKEFIKDKTNYKNLKFTPIEN